MVAKGLVGLVDVRAVDKLTTVARTVIDASVVSDYAHVTEIDAEVDYNVV